MEKPTRTLRAIGKALNLSDGTVSRALSGRGDVAQDTRNRVVELAAELQYFPRRKNGKRIGALTRIAICVGNRCVGPDGNLDLNFVGLHLLSQLEQVASQSQVGVMVGFVDAMAPDQRIDRMPMFQPGETQGIILVYPFPEQVVRHLTTLAPVVSIEHVYPSASLDVIGPTHAVDAMSAVEYLHRLGHRRIAYLSDEDARGHQLTLGLRHAGFVSGMARCGLTYRPDDVINVGQPLIPKSQLAEAIAARVRDGVTAVVTSIDRHGYMLWQELPALGIDVPKDVSLVGIGGIYRSKGLPQLTTWRCDYESIASAALEALNSRRAGDTSTKLYQEITSVFVQGETSAAPR
jgi:DNA-binding LacI/PurR family transcriptional regulator